jgi:hypothetical protein
VHSRKSSRLWYLILILAQEMETLSFIARQEGNT